MQLVRRAGVEFQIAGQGDDVVARLFQRFADIQSLQFGQKVDAGLHLAAHAGQDAAALHRRRPTPFALERGASGLDGRVHVGGCSGRQPAHAFTRGGVLDRQGRPPVRRPPDAADEDLIRGEGRRHTLPVHP